MKTKEQTIKGKNGPCSFELTKEYFWGQDEESGVYFKFTVTKNFLRTMADVCEAFCFFRVFSGP